MTMPKWKLPKWKTKWRMKRQENGDRLHTLPGAIRQLLDNHNRLRQDTDDLLRALNALIDYYHPRGEFIACVTAPHKCDMTPKERKQCPAWSKWDNAVEVADRVGSRLMGQALENASKPVAR